MKNSFLLPCLAALTFTVGCSRAVPATEQAAPLPAVKVQTTKLHFETVPLLTEITGTVQPVQKATIAARLMGTIVELPVTLGQRVQAGDLLVKISAGEISARLIQAQAQLDQAKSDLARERELLPKNASTADLVQNLETRVTLSTATVQEAETMLGYASIRAPFAGVVARKLVENGDLATPGTPLLEIEGQSAYRVEAGIPDSLANALTIGAAVEITIPSTNQTFTGTLAELSSAADANAHTVHAKFTVPTDLAVRSGQFARVLAPGTEVRVLLVTGKRREPHRPDGTCLRRG